jgi:hypothetical protein
MTRGLQQQTAHLIRAGGMLWQAVEGAGDQAAAAEAEPRPPPRRAAFGVGPGRGRGSVEWMEGADKRHRGRARRHGVAENGAKEKGKDGRGWPSLARRRLFPASKLQSGFEQAPPAAPVGLHTGRRRRLTVGLGWAVFVCSGPESRDQTCLPPARQSQNGSAQRDTPTQTRVARQPATAKGSAPLPAEPPARAQRQRRWFCPTPPSAARANKIGIRLWRDG